MDKRIIISLLFLLIVVIGFNQVSAYSSFNYNKQYSDWDALNYEASQRTAHNRLSDYWKYGSYWQHNGNYPVYNRISISNNYYYSKGNRLTIYNHYQNNYHDNNVKIHYSYPEKPYGRFDTIDKTYVLNCGFGDGLYSGCY